MRIYKAKNYDDMSRKAANIISAQIIMKPNCVLGLATGSTPNGHIAFNEPNIAFEKTTHLVALTESTIQANSRLFNDISQVPKNAYTMGIKNIVQAKKVILVASGKEKAQIVKQAFFGPVTPSVPASILQMHNDVTLVCDEEALSLI